MRSKLNLVLNRFGKPLQYYFFMYETSLNSLWRNVSIRYIKIPYSNNTLWSKYFVGVATVAVFLIFIWFIQIYFIWIEKEYCKYASRFTRSEAISQWVEKLRRPTQGSSWEVSNPRLNFLVNINDTYISNN